jgi:DNA-binding MarR family transcriptional regulator
MRPDDDDDVARIRELLERATLASVRYRLALSERLGLEGDATAALLHLAQHAPLTAGELSVRLVITPAQATTALQLLEERGYVSSERDPREPGVRAYVLTEQAKEEIAVRGRPLADSLDAAAAELSRHELAVVTRYLERITAVTEQDRNARAHEAIEGVDPSGARPPASPDGPRLAPPRDAGARPPASRGDAAPGLSERHDVD